MTTHGDVARSVHRRLLNEARAQGTDFNRLLIRYANERLLYRLQHTPEADQFVLKGAMVFSLWAQVPHRSTADMDLLGYGSAAQERIADVFRDVCEVRLSADDGLIFDPSSVRTEEIRKSSSYGGVRVHVIARLGPAKILVKVDIGFGEATVPAPEHETVPTILDHPAPRLRAYKRETVIAEKFHAIVDLGERNNRLKDYFDLWFLAAHFEFDGDILGRALQATFKRRGKALPVVVPPGLSGRFATKNEAQWKTFIQKATPTAAPKHMKEASALVRRLLLPVVEHLHEGKLMNSTWKRKSGWQQNSGVKTP